MRESGYCILEQFISNMENPSVNQLKQPINCSILYIANRHWGLFMFQFAILAKSVPVLKIE